MQTLLSLLLGACVGAVLLALWLRYRPFDGQEPHALVRRPEARPDGSYKLARPLRRSDRLRGLVRGMLVGAAALAGYGALVGLSSGSITLAVGLAIYGGVLGLFIGGTAGYYW